MSERAEIPRLPGFFSVKEAAEILNTTDKMIYYYVDNERLGASRVGSTLLIPEEELEKFQQKSVGRPRTKTPAWRIPTGDNKLFVLSIKARIQDGKQKALIKKLSEIRRQRTHNFTGTVARFIIGYNVAPEEIEILLIWKTGVAPDEAAREQDIDAFRQELADVLDWNTVRFNTGEVFMNT